MSGRIVEVGALPALLAGLVPVAAKVAGYLGLVFAPTALEALVVAGDEDLAGKPASEFARQLLRTQVDMLSAVAASLTGTRAQKWTFVRARALQIAADASTTALEAEQAIRQLAAALSQLQTAEASAAPTPTSASLEVAPEKAAGGVQYQQRASREARAWQALKGAGVAVAVGGLGWLLWRSLR